MPIPTTDSSKRADLSNVWLPLRSSHPSATSRLFCFPYAGGGASAFRTWSAPLEPRIEVCSLEYPGRWSRHREKCETSVAGLASAIVGGISGLLDRPFAFFGYSFGTVLAFEVARMLRSKGLAGPTHLFVGARHAPQDVSPVPPIHALPSAQFLDEIDRRFGILPAAVRRDPDLLKMVLPVLRADMTALETYAYREAPPLDCPISAFAGKDDKLISLEDLAPWGQQSSASFTAQSLPGGHFFMSESGPSLIEIVRTTLEAQAA